MIMQDFMSDAVEDKQPAAPWKMPWMFEKAVAVAAAVAVVGDSRIHAANIHCPSVVQGRALNPGRRPASRPTSVARLPYEYEKACNIIRLRARSLPFQHCWIVCAACSNHG